VTINHYLEYPFAKYNIQPTTYTYSQDEYTRFLEGEIVLKKALILFIYLFFHRQGVDERGDGLSV
jgi:hypothetical protein